MKQKTAQTVLKDVSHFYCDKCKKIRRVKKKPQILHKQGPYLVCEGPFICGKCGFQTSTFCENCGKVQPVFVKEPWMEGETDDFLGGDVLCSYCRLVLTTIYKVDRGSARSKQIVVDVIDGMTKS